MLAGNKPTISYYRVFGCKCFYKIKGGHLSKFESKALEGIFVGYGAESHTYRVYDKSLGRVVESCSVEFDENDGSQVAQFHVRDVDNEEPQDAIRRMGVGFFRPVEIHHERPQAIQASPSSTQVEIPSSQVEPAPTMEAHDAPIQEQVQDPPQVDQVAMQEPSTHIVEASQGQDQDQPLMHVKCIHELCIILLIFQSYLHHIRVISLFYNDFWEYFTVSLFFWN
jgi:hypothetical protein